MPCSNIRVYEMKDHLWPDCKTRSDVVVYHPKGFPFHMIPDQYIPYTGKLLDAAVKLRSKYKIVIVDKLTNTIISTTDLMTSKTQNLLACMNLDIR